jgi:hypothetical protein
VIDEPRANRSAAQLLHDDERPPAARHPEVRDHYDVGVADATERLSLGTPPRPLLPGMPVVVRVFVVTGAISPLHTMSAAIQGPAT